MTGGAACILLLRVLALVLRFILVLGSIGSRVGPAVNRTPKRAEFSRRWGREIKVLAVVPSRRRKPPETKRTVRGQIWVEVGGRQAITSRGADLLEQIAVHGSLLEATRQLKMGYRSAWSLLRAMNESWPKPLVNVKAGGHHGGGMYLTPTGQHVLRTYRDLQAQLDHLIDSIGQQAIARIGRTRRRPSRRPTS